MNREAKPMTASNLLSVNPALDTIRDPFSPHTEALRSLRQGLRMHRDGDAGVVLTVVSPGAREGKSRLAAELAWLLAQLEEPTLLVDANLRAPSQQLLFTGTRGEGLADALQRNALPVIHGVTGAEHLKVVMAGEPPKHPVELLAHQGFGALLAEWRNQFRHVVIDTPAFTASSDALAVSVEAGAALMVVREQHSSLPGLRQTAERLRAGRVAVLGTVSLAF